MIMEAISAFLYQLTCGIKECGVRDIAIDTHKRKCVDCLNNQTVQYLNSTPIFSAAGPK